MKRKLISLILCGLLSLLLVGNALAISYEEAEKYIGKEVIIAHEVSSHQIICVDEAIILQLLKNAYYPKGYFLVAISYEASEVYCVPLEIITKIYIKK